FFSSRRRHTRSYGDWSSDVCSSDLYAAEPATPTYKLSTPCSVAGQFCVVSLKDVVDGRVPKTLVTGRTVFVGAHSISAVPDDYRSEERRVGKECTAR